MLGSGRCAGCTLTYLNSKTTSCIEAWVEQPGLTGFDPVASLVSVLGAQPRQAASLVHRAKPTQLSYPVLGAEQQGCSTQASMQDVVLL